MTRRRLLTHIAYWILLVLVFVGTSLLWRWTYFVVRWESAPSPGRAFVQLEERASTNGIPSGELNPQVFGQNAALYYWQAFNYRSVVYSESVMGSKPFFDINHSWSGPNSNRQEDLNPDPETPKLIRFTQRFIDLYLKGTRMDYCVWDAESKLTKFFNLQQELVQSKYMVQLVGTHMRYRIHQGRETEALDLFESVFRFGDHFNEQSQLVIGLLIQRATEAIIINGLAADMPHLEEESLRRLQEFLAGLKSPLEFRYGPVFASTLSFHLENLKQLIDRAQNLENRQDVLKYVHQDMRVPFQDIHSVLLRPGNTLNQVESQLVPLLEDLLEAASTTTDQEFKNELDRVQSKHEDNPFWNGPDRVSEGESPGGVKMSVSRSSWLSREPMDKMFIKEQSARIRILMLRAAVAHRLGDTETFSNILDPTTGEPFKIEPTEVGFKVISDHSWSSDPEDKLYLQVGQKSEFPEGFWEQESSEALQDGGPTVDDAGNVLFPLNTLVDEINKRTGTTK